MYVLTSASLHESLETCDLELQRNSGNVADDRRTFRFEFSGEWRINVENIRILRGVPGVVAIVVNCSQL